MPNICPNPQCKMAFESHEDLIVHISWQGQTCYAFFLGIGCPNPHCEERFQSAEEVTAHLNQQESCIRPFIPLSMPEWNDDEASAPIPTYGPATRWVQQHPTSGWKYGTGRNILQEIDHSDRYSHRRKLNVYYPWRDAAEWKMARFLNETLTLNDADRFLRLDWVREHQYPAINAQNLRDWIEILPGGPSWKMTPINTAHSYPTTKPIYLYWRDGLEAAKWIFGNPVFANHMQYDPVKVFTDEFGDEREFSEYMTADYAWNIQDQLPDGATQLGIICGSDKTPVTLGTGGLEMHPLFLTLANIRSEVRMKATSHAWICVGFIPIGAFKIHTDFQGVLKARLWHQCVEIITRSLRSVARNGDYTPDPNGDIRFIFTPLIAWTADHPEQQLIACVAKNASPVTLAVLDKFGDNFRHPPRTARHTLSILYGISKEKHIDPWDLTKFLRECKEQDLSGVHQPFWADWVFSDPSIFLVPEILHTCHKFFFDHLLGWCKEIIGAEELDARYKVLHRRVGIRHFPKGISHVQQMTGREHREIQRSIVSVIHGAAPTGVVRVVRSMVDFIYRAQAHCFTTASIQQMQASLDDFHRWKDEITKAGGRQGKNGPMGHFNLPKLELMQHFAGTVFGLGNLIQHTADVTERLLITHCKDRFIASSHGLGFEKQIVRDLDRSGLSLVNTAVASEAVVISTVHPESAWISRVLPGEDRRLGGPRPMRNFFKDGFVAENTMRAYHVKKTPDLKSISLALVLPQLNLPYLEGNLQNIFRTPTAANLHIWNTFKIQHYAVHQRNLLLPAQTIQAYSEVNGQETNGDPIIFEQEIAGGYINRIAQVRLVFEIDCEPTTTYAYVEPFFHVNPTVASATSASLKEADVEMHVVAREYVEVPGHGCIRFGMIIRLDQISHAVDLTPCFGSHISPALTKDNSLDLPTTFFLNDHGYKELYETFSTLYL